MTVDEQNALLDAQEKYETLVEKITALADAAKPTAYLACECGFQDPDDVPEGHVCVQKSIGWNLNPDDLRALLEEG